MVLADTSLQMIKCFYFMLSLAGIECFFKDFKETILLLFMSVVNLVFVSRNLQPLLVELVLNKYHAKSACL